MAGSQGRLSSLDGQLTIRKSGNVGIGTAEPAAKLHVKGNLDHGVFGITDAYSGSMSWETWRAGVCGETTASGADDRIGVGVLGIATTGGGSMEAGVAGVSNNGTGVRGESTGGVGVNGFSVNEKGVAGESDSGYGIYGMVKSSSGYAGLFEGGKGIRTTSLEVKDMLAVGDTAVYWNTGNGKIGKSSSSRKYKEDIKDLIADFPKILEAKPKSFKYKSTGTSDIGYIAEDFDALGLKELVIYKDGDPESLKYDKIALYLLEVIKELKTKNEQMEARFRALEEKVK